MPALPWLRVDGARIVDEHGSAVVLHGVGLGGWMNMENFITGYPGPEQLQRAAPAVHLGRGGLRALLHRVPPRVLR